MLWLAIIFVFTDDLLIYILNFYVRTTTFTLQKWRFFSSKINKCELTLLKCQHELSSLFHVLFTELFDIPIKREKITIKVSLLKILLSMAATMPCCSFFSENNLNLEVETVLTTRTLFFVIINLIILFLMMCTFPKRL